MKRLRLLFTDHARLVVKLIILTMTFSQMASAAITTNYVAQGGQTPAGTFTTWDTAASNIQDAISVAIDAGSIVLVSNGVYDTGGVTDSRVGVVTNRVAITNAITVRSANNDPINTIIKGAWHNNTTTGVAAVRGVFMVAGSSLIGFTVTNGATDTYPGGSGTSGGGIDSYSSSCIISNCIITGNWAGRYGGGVEASSCRIYNSMFVGNRGGQGAAVRNGKLYNCLLTGNRGVDDGVGEAYGAAYQGTLYNCTLTDNFSTLMAAGAYLCTLYNCLVANNSARYSAGMRDCTIYNCTIVSNTATVSDGVGGAQGGHMINSIVYFNKAPTYSNWNSTISFTNSCTYPAATNGVGNTTANPLFVDTNTANYRLSANSPCINAGMNFSWMTDGSVSSRDLDGHSRIDRFSRIVDIGCYEYLPSGIMFGFR